MKFRDTVMNTGGGRERGGKPLRDARWLTEMVDFIAPKNTDVVLDLGTRDGNAAIALSSKVQKIYAIDPSREDLEVLKGRLTHPEPDYVKYLHVHYPIENIEIQEGRAEDLKFEDKFFDLVVCRASFRYCADHVKALSEIHRVLKDDGRFMLCDPFLPDKVRQAWTILKAFQNKEWVDYFTYNEYIRMLRNAGFDVIAMRPVEYHSTIRTVAAAKSRTFTPGELPVAVRALQNFTQEQRRLMSLVEKENGDYAYRYDGAEILAVKAKSRAHSDIDSLREELKKRMNEIIKLIAPSTDDKALDLGTGHGNIAFKLAKVVAKVDAIDPEQENIDECEQEMKKRGISNVKFHLGAAEKLPFDDQHFDIVTCRGAFHHFSEPMMALSEAHRILKDGGKFYLSDPFFSGRAKEIWTPLAQTRETDLHSFYTYNEYIQMLRESGFEVQRIVPFDFYRDLEEWTFGGIAADIRERDPSDAAWRERLMQVILGLDAQIKEEMRISQIGDHWVFCYNGFDLLATK